MTLIMPIKVTTQDGQVLQSIQEVAQQLLPAKVRCVCVCAWSPGQGALCVCMVPCSRCAVCACVQGPLHKVRCVYAQGPLRMSMADGAAPVSVTIPSLA